MANKHRKVWKVVSRKVNFGKQTWPRKEKFKIGCLKIQLDFVKSLIEIFKGLIVRKLNF
jgi:hypothetical protein